MSEATRGTEAQEAQRHRGTAASMSGAMLVHGVWQHHGPTPYAASVLEKRGNHAGNVLGGPGGGDVVTSDATLALDAVGADETPALHAGRGEPFACIDVTRRRAVEAEARAGGTVVA